MADFQMAGEDLLEEEVWAVMKGKESRKNNSNNNNDTSGSSPNRRSSARSIPRGGGGEHSVRRSSAPVHIPNWSKILKKKPKKSPWDDSCEEDEDGQNNGGVHVRDDDEEEDNEVDGDVGVPPHEYLARRMASTQIASFSMCEGVGRTLKGRDLSRLRNAILTKTGFIE